MRVLKVFVLVFAVLAGMAALIPTVKPAFAQAAADTVHCDQFKAQRWTMAGSSGNRYALIMHHVDLTCKVATAYAKKLMTTSLPKGATTPQHVRGGPQGYTCYITPDQTGRPLGGECRQIGAPGEVLGAFNWFGTTK